MDQNASSDYNIAYQILYKKLKVYILLFYKIVTISFLYDWNIPIYDTLTYIYFMPIYALKFHFSHYAKNDENS